MPSLAEDVARFMSTQKTANSLLKEASTDALMAEVEHRAIGTQRDGINIYLDRNMTICIEHYNKIPFIPGCLYLANGDPGFPDEGGQIEDIEISLWINETQIPLTRAAHDELVEENRTAIEDAIEEAI